MAAIQIKGFRGEVPRLSDRLLQGNQATIARNCKLTSGRLDPLRGLGLDHESDIPYIKTLFKYRYHPASGDPIDKWLTWPSDVDAVMSPLANDSQGKFYFTSDEFDPCMSTYADAISGVGPYPALRYTLGIPNPSVAPSVSTTGGVGLTEERSYAFTFVTRYGEESGPSKASTLVSGKSDGTWLVSGLQAEPPNSGTVVSAIANSPEVGKVKVGLDTVFGLAPGDRIVLAGVVGFTALNGTHKIFSVNAATNEVVLVVASSQTYTSGGSWIRVVPINTFGMTKRIYRTSGTSGQFLFVDEVSGSSASYSDVKPGTQLGELITTANVLPPPKSLTCLISLPNGCLVGLADNELCFSDPYIPYSWPAGNRYTFSGRGVALCAAGNSVIVLTDTFPILFTGSDPEAMTPSVMETYAPCVSKRGMAAVGGGCLYPSFDGLWLATPSGVQNVTKKLYRDAEWTELNPKSFVGAFHDGQYYSHYTSVNQNISRVWILDMSEPDSIVEVEETATELYRNEYDGVLYLAKGANIYAWEKNPGNRYETDWVSTTFQMPRPTNFAVAQVHADYTATVPIDYEVVAKNQELIDSGADAVAGHLNGHEILAFELHGSYIVPQIADKLKKVQFTLYKDSVPIFTKGVVSSTPFRLPAGYRTEIFNIGLNASVNTYSVSVAESVAELVPASA